MNTKRTATVTSLSECQCWVLNGAVFKQIIAKATLKRRHLNLQYLDSVPLLSKLETFEKIRLIDGLQQRTYTHGEFVVRENEPGEEFFVIEQG
jgi:cAMP-dependent protein kinase regulator